MAKKIGEEGMQTTREDDLRNKKYILTLEVKLEVLPAEIARCSPACTAYHSTRKQALTVSLKAFCRFPLL